MRLPHRALLACALLAAAPAAAQNLISTGTSSGLRLYMTNGNDFWLDPTNGSALIFKVNGNPVSTMTAEGFWLVNGVNAVSNTGITASSFTATITGNAQYSIRSSSGINVTAGGVTAGFFNGMHVGDGSRLTGVTSSPSGAAGGDLSGSYPSPTLNLGLAHNWTGAQTFGAAGAASYDIAVSTRGLLTFNAGTLGAGGVVVGGLGFRNMGVSHGQFHYRGGTGFEMLDVSADGPAIDHASTAFAPLRAGAVTGNSFSGNGAGLTSLDPANLSAGTAGISVTGNAATVTNGVYTTGSYADPAWLTSVAGSKVSANIFNNYGNTHPTYTDFNVPADFGYRYIQGTLNGPGIPSATQYYNWGIGLGSEYPYANYAMQMAIPRTPSGGNPYLSVRFREATAWGGWSKIYAGYADTAGGAPPTGPAGGNLGGTYPNPSIASLPAISGANLTSLTAANIAAGTAGISITGNAATATTATNTRYVNSPDGDRANHIAPNALVRNLQLDFKNASAVGGTGNYSGVLTYSPWDGTTASTGDPSYQVAFYSNVANGTLPRMRIRNGIDTTWNAWYDVWNASSDGSGSGLDADVVDGLNPTSAATGSTLMSRDANGDSNVRYLVSSYLNMSHAASGATTDAIFYSSTDDYIRKNNATGFRASLNVPTRTGGDASGDWSINILGNVVARTKSDAGAIASRSGFFETSVPANYYSGASSWQHLMEARHTNDANNYAMQIAGSFFDQEFYARKTNNSATTAWSRLIRQDPGIGTAIGGTGAAAGAGASDLTANGTVFFGTGGSYKVTSAGAATLATSAFGGVNPTADNVGNIGTTALRWTTAHAVNFYGAYNAGPDLAERYPASEPVEPGDLVLFDPDPPAHATVFDQSKVARVNEVGGRKIPVAVKKSSTPYQAGLLGVISTAPGVKLHDPDDETNPPVALIGRVPVKVCDENGPIKVGDRLTSSSRPGRAMRATSAGPAVAIALQAFDGKEGKILAFVQAGEANVSQRLEALSRENALMKERLERLERLVSGGK